MNNAFTHRFAPLVGRILLSLLFIWAGYGKLTNFGGTAGYMAQHGLPLTNVLLVITIIVELGGGLALLLGWYSRWAALIMFLFIIPVTLVFHNFWAADAAHYQMQLINFMKNVSIMGGMLMLAANGPGPIGINQK
ncbi:MAG TPA: DoxX family protein [Gammaproteobacteria bacterium]|nr:DoxX family protein [Gammaproteobacteria bacterium]